jgi:predicted transcriptional regulator of viral defense system
MHGAAGTHPLVCCPTVAQYERKRRRLGRGSLRSQQRRSHKKARRQKQTNAEEAADAAGMTVAETKEMADELSYRGWLNRVTRCGINFCHTLAFAHGIL